MKKKSMLTGLLICLAMGTITRISAGSFTSTAKISTFSPEHKIVTKTTNTKKTSANAKVVGRADLLKIVVTDTSANAYSKHDPLIVKEGQAASVLYNSFSSGVKGTRINVYIYPNSFDLGFPINTTVNYY